MINPGNHSSQFNRHEALRKVGAPAGLAIASGAGGLSGAASGATTILNASDRNRAIHSRIRISGAPALLAILCIGAAGLPAVANQGTPEQRRACTPDVLRLCAEFVPDPNRITVCLQDKIRYLSPACQIVMGASVRR
jgi:hypothetical protein